MRKKRWGFWVEIDGQPAHINGDPDMPQETLDALIAAMRAMMQLTPEEIEEIRRKQQEEAGTE